MRAGVASLLIGPSAPPRDLGRFAALRRPVAVIVSSSMVAHLPGAWACIEAVHDAGAPVLAGGTGFGPDGELAAAVGADAWAADLATAVSTVAAWEQHGPPPLRQQPELPRAHRTLVGRGRDVTAAARDRALAAANDGGGGGGRDVIDLLCEHAVELAEAATLLGRIELLHGDVEWMRSVAAGRGLPASLADEIVDAVVGEVQRAR